MAHREPSEVIRDWFVRVWNQGELFAVDEILAPEAVGHGLGGGEIIGPEQFKQFAGAFREAVPDINIEVLRTVTQGSLCAAHCLVTGTHRGGGLGMAATGNAIRFEGMTIFRIENGRIHEGWNSFDFLSLYQQIGALPKLPGQ